MRVWQIIDTDDLFGGLSHAENRKLVGNAEDIFSRGPTYDGLDLRLRPPLVYGWILYRKALR